MRFSVNYSKEKGPYVSCGGEEVFRLHDESTGVEAFHQFGNGDDAFRILNPNGIGFKRRPFAGEVIPSGLHAAWSGCLRTAISLVGANHTALPRPGYDPLNGLHTGLASLPDVPEKRRIDGSEDGPGITQVTYYELDNTGTSPLIYAHAGVERRATLMAGPYGTVYVIADDIKALSACRLGIVNHPNPLAQVGDRVILPNIDSECIVRDRDGKATIEMHPFVSASDKFLGAVVAERCFFLFIPPLDDGFVPMLLLREDGKGIGMRYRYVPDHPYAMVWYSPAGNYGLEFGDLPLGAPELDRLEMLHTYQPGEGWINELEIHFLNDEEAAKAFAAANKMDLSIVGPVDIEASGPDHAALAEAAATYNAKLLGV